MSGYPTKYSVAESPPEFVAAPAKRIRMTAAKIFKRKLKFICKMSKLRFSGQLRRALPASAQRGAETGRRLPPAAGRTQRRNSKCPSFA
jgi:hypothetical protein